MLELLRLLLICGTVLLFAFLALLAMPASRLRDIVMPFVGVAVSALSVAYIALPIDVLPELFLGPFGLVDDAAALVVAIGSAITAMNVVKSPKPLR